MNILHVIDSGGLFGAENVLLSLMEQQLKSGINSIVGSITRPSIEAKELDKVALGRGFHVHSFVMKQGYIFTGALNIVQYTKKHNIDVIHSHGYKSNILLGFFPKAF